MKKILVILAAAAICASTANAQSSLGDLLKKAGSVVSDAVAGTTTSTLDLSGPWTYNGCAIGATSDNVLASLAANTATSSVETKCDELLAKAGIKKGVASFTFNSDGSFKLSAGKLSLPGTWTKTDTAVNMTFTKPISLTLKGTVKSTTDGCQILFESDKFLNFIKKVLSVAGQLTSNSTLTAVQTALNSVDGVQLGFKLKK